MRNAHNLDEAVKLLSDGGVLTRLKDEAQSEREAERAGLLDRLADLEKRQAEDGAQAEETRAATVARIAELEASLATARKDLAAIEAPNGITLDQLRGKLRRLADPRIGEAIMELSDLFDKARGAFVTGNFRVKKMLGYSSEATSNALPIADALADIKQARIELETLQEQQRPDDLDAVIAAKINPIRMAVRKLNGFK